MVEAWEFIKSFWEAIHTILSIVYLSVFPFFVIAVWRLVGRLDIFARMEKAAKGALAAEDKWKAESGWAHNSYRDNLSDHEKALRKMGQAPDPQKYNGRDFS